MAIILYARKSVENEASISCETQLEYCRSMLRPHEQDDIISIVDNGCSGGNMEREGFRRMMKLVQENKVTKVVVYKLDRFSRSFVDFANSMEIFREHKVKFVSSQEAFDTSSTYGEMVMQILMVFAQFERSSIIDRITQAYAHRSELGFYMGGKRPYGFELVPTVIHGIKSKKLQIIPSEANVLKQIYSTYSQEGTSLRRLQDWLLQNGKNDRQWTTSKLSVLLKNPIYVRADADIYEYFSQRGVQIKSEPSQFIGIYGAQLYGKSKHDSHLHDWSDTKLVLLPHEGIIDSTVWLRCQHKLERNRQIGSNYSNSSSWLSGKVFCKLCGHSMNITKSSPNKSGNVRRYFNCSGKSNKKTCCGPDATIYAEELEDLINESIKEKLSSIRFYTLSPTDEHRADINELKLKIKTIEQSEQQLMFSLLSGNCNEALIELVNRQASLLKQERQTLCIRIEELKQSRSTPSTPDLIELWNAADYSHKKAIAMLLLHKIYIHKDGRAEILWNL